MADNVKVAVRVRPFREIQHNATLIIGMSGSQTTIKDPKNMSQEPKKFAFDYSYWSHDGYKVQPDGYMEAESANFADQKKVFTDLGLGVLENAWKGYNCSLFAYGQTGSGKTYSMMGFGSNRGIVPLAFEELFRSIEEKRKTAKADEEYQVTLSMLEIYNEQVRDLLNSKTLQKGGLKVRQHPTKGFYVETLSHSPVSNYTDIDSKMNEGTRNRTVASTNMNATSSRAHTIVAINFVQKAANEAGQNMTKTSIVNLVDLAGSERADSTGATGDRLKEGSAINQSLSTLGNVIKALADRKAIVPYRDSVLTKLLQNALGGNSKTIMIAALSPADINYEETLSTLRFADRAKAIKTKAVINESPTDRLIRELREENARLMDMLKKGGVPMETGGGGSNDEDVEEMKKQLEEQMRQNQQELEDMKKSWQQRIQEAEVANMSQAAEEKKEQDDRKVIPHLWNLNEDPALTGMVVHFVRPGKSRIGNSRADPPPEIVMSGLSIQKEHALITNKNTVTLTPFPGAKVKVNGKAVAGDTVLRHNDRVMLGSNHLYVFHHPQDEARLQKEGKAVPPPTFDSAQEEIMKETGLLSDAQNKEKSQNDLLLQEDLIKMLPVVNEANAMSEELDKRVKFELALISSQSRGQPGGQTEVMVKMVNLDSGNEWLFDRSNFINRKYLMQEMYQNYMEVLEWDVPKEKDPFWEPATTPILIGTVHVYLQSLGFLVEIQETLAIANYKGEEKGQLTVEIVPCNSKWVELHDEFVDDPSELLSKSAFFKMKVVNARGLPNNIDKSYCKYSFFNDLPVDTETVGGTINPDYEHEKKFSIKSVSNDLLKYLAESMLVIEVWGTQKEGASGAPGLAPPRVQQERSNVSQKSDAGFVRCSPSPTPPETASVANLQNLLKSAKASGKTTITIAELEAILSGGGSSGAANSSAPPKAPAAKNSTPAKTSTAGPKAPAGQNVAPVKPKVTKEKPKDQSSRACTVQ